MKLTIAPESAADRDFVLRAKVLGLDWYSLAAEYTQLVINQVQEAIAKHDNKVASALRVYDDMERQRKIDEKDPNYWHPERLE